MKKSTLITTIAMIVVVVVALSTATYAWFTAQQTTVVEMSVSTSADAGWGMLANTATIGAGKYQTTASGTAMVFSGTSGISALNSGLWCPTGEVSAELSSDTNVCNYTPGIRFFGATQNDVSNNTVITCDVAPNYYQSEVVRITNATAEAKTGLLTITISFPSTDQAETTVLSSAVAAAGLRFVVINGNAVAAATDYYYISSVEARGSAAEISNVNSMVATENANTYTAGYTLFDATTAGKSFTGKPNLSTAASIDPSQVSSTGDTSGGFTFTTTAINTKGVAANSFYCDYTLNLGSIGAGLGKNYAIYYWLDGALLSTEAGAAGISLHFSVGDAS